MLAIEEFHRTGKIRVIVQDNGPIHKSRIVQEKWSEWEGSGLYIFFLPAYCSQLMLPSPEELETA